MSDPVPMFSEDAVQYFLRNALPGMFLPLGNGKRLLAGPISFKEFMGHINGGFSISVRSLK